MFGDWSDRIANGELPFAKPQRPQGKERNIVVTLWDWNTPKAYLHDEISTDRRNPTLNAHGKIYGSPEESSDIVPVLDPVKKKGARSRRWCAMPRRPTPRTMTFPILRPIGAEAIWNSQTSIHNPMFDEKGRVWLTTRVRAPEQCRPSASRARNHPSAKLFPLKSSGRQLAVYDPATKKFTPIDTCYAHPPSAVRQARTGSGPAAAGRCVGWFDTKDLGRDP